MTQTMPKTSWRTVLAFWCFGFCNNMTFFLMLGAAEDLLHRSKHEDGLVSRNLTCLMHDETRKCDGLKSTGIVLLADVLPYLTVQIMFPLFIAQYLSFGFRHILTCVTQAASLLIIAVSNSLNFAIIGVCLTSISTGIGETSLVAMSTHYPHASTIAWSAGTGMSAFLGSFMYALLTEPHFLGLAPEIVMLGSLSVPILFAFAYWVILENAPPICSSSRSDEVIELENTQIIHVPQRKTNFIEKMALIRPLLKFIVPTTIVYIAEFVINQGMDQFLIFDCDHSWSLSKESQYRWYQTTYAFGVAVSRSSLLIDLLPSHSLFWLAILQPLNAVFFYSEVLYSFVPHIWVVFILIFVEGLYGGTAYAKSINDIHRTVDADIKEFSMGFATLSCSLGVLIAGFISIGIHNATCRKFGFK